MWGIGIAIDVRPPSLCRSPASPPSLLPHALRLSLLPLAHRSPFPPDHALCRCRRTRPRHSAQNAIKLKDIVATLLELAVVAVLRDVLAESGPGRWWEEHLDHFSVLAATLTAADSTLARKVKKHLEMRARIEPN